MSDYYYAWTRYQEHEREVKKHLLVQQALNASRSKQGPGAIARAWSWLSCKATALLPGRHQLPALGHGGC
jgi:hypothetical protein